ncbi:MAG: 3,4-dihydroxy-2-butanone-4-phosphate synthase, partial [Rhodobacteraceae bacterium]|nr:3,4-dihydroxy-2-butanone-4-phosphate synthase [Paracoccaceae bacterium]
EAGCDLASLAGLKPAAVICEIMNEDGTMARLPDLIGFAQKHGLKIGTISDLIAYRRRHDNLVRETDRRPVTSTFGGEWLMRIFTDQPAGTDHVVLTKGDITTPEPVLVRTHALNAMEDLLGIGEAPGVLPRAMQIIAEEGRGAVCLFRDPRAKLALTEDEGPRTVKHTGLGAQILSTLGLHELVLLTDSPLTRYVGLDAYGLRIVGTRPITTE